MDEKEADAFAAVSFFAAYEPFFYIDRKLLLRSIKKVDNSMQLSYNIEWKSMKLSLMLLGVFLEISLSQLVA